MNILIVAATPMEIAPFTATLMDEPISLQKLYVYPFKNHTLSIFATGVGLLHTAFHMAQLLANKTYDIVFNVGIAGSFSSKLALGQCVWVTSQIVGDLGIEKNHSFVPIHQLPFYEENQFPYQQGYLSASTSTENPVLQSLVQVQAITVNRVTGSLTTIENMKKLFNPTIENMEGAAFFYACLWQKIPFYELRTISNYVTVRDKNQWNIPLAVQELSKVLWGILKTL